MKRLIILFVVIISTNSFAQSKIVSSKELKKIEIIIQKKLQSKELDPKKKFYGTLLAGRELYQYRFFDRAEKYYQDAKAIQINENKSEAYINLIAIALIEKNKKKVGERFKEATKYFESNNSFKTTEVDYYLATISNYLGDKKSSPVDGFYGRFSQEENLINLLKNKEYEKALSSLNPEAIAKSNSSYEVTIYDILNVLVNGKQVKNLYCTDEFTKYPNSYAYSTIVCGLLTDYLKNNSFDKKHMDRAKVYFNEEAQDKRYMLDMVKEINK